MDNDDKRAIREVIENWVLWRDAGDWDRFATVWHEDGWMTATWFQGPARAFIEVSRDGFNRGVNILHFLGGFTCDVAGSRASRACWLMWSARGAFTTFSNGGPTDGASFAGSQSTRRTAWIRWIRLRR